MGNGNQRFYLSPDIPPDIYVEMVPLPRYLIRIDFNFHGSYTPKPSANIRLMRGDIIEKIQSLTSENRIYWQVPALDVDRSLQISRSGDMSFWGDVEIRWEWQEPSPELLTPIKPALLPPSPPQEKLCPKCRETWVEL